MAVSTFPDHRSGSKPISTANRRASKTCRGPTLYDAMAMATRSGRSRSANWPIRDPRYLAPASMASPGWCGSSTPSSRQVMGMNWKSPADPPGPTASGSNLDSSYISDASSRQSIPFRLAAQVRYSSYGVRWPSGTGGRRGEVFRPPFSETLECQLLHQPCGPRLGEEIHRPWIEARATVGFMIHTRGTSGITTGPRTRSLLLSTSRATASSSTTAL